MITTRLWQAAAIAAAVLIGLQTARLHTAQRAADKARLQLATERAAAADAARRQSETYRAQEAAHREAITRIDTQAQAALAGARGDAAAAAAAGRLLRARLAALQSACRAAPGHPDPASLGPPASAPADLLADVQRRLDDAADAIAAAADKSRIAGLACERAYDAVMARD